MKKINVESQIKDLEKYKDSRIALFKFEVEKASNQSLASFKINHSENEAKQFAIVQEKTNLAKIDNFISKIEKKTKKKQDKVAKKAKDYEKRVWEIDFARGLIIIGMLFYHLVVDFRFVPEIFGFVRANEFFIALDNFQSSFSSSLASVYLRYIGVILLLFISGICTKFSKNSLKGAIKILAVAFIITGVFALVALISKNPMNNLIFGAVMCIGVCMLIYSLIKIFYFKIFKKEKYFKWVILALAAGLFFLSYFIAFKNPALNTFYTGCNGFLIFNNYFYGIPCITTLDEFWPNIGNVIIGRMYFGADNLPLFPSLFYMFVGAFVGETLYSKKKSVLSYIPSKGEIGLNERLNRIFKPINFCGIKSLWIYIIHQPVFVVIILLLALLMGVSFNIKI